MQTNLFSVATKLEKACTEGLTSFLIFMITHILLKGTRRPTAKRNNSHPGTRKSVYLWEFLFGLLEDEECSLVISWTSKREGIFTLHNPDELAMLWGTVKNRPNMHKYKLFRAMRNYYGKGMLRKVTDVFFYILFHSPVHSGTIVEKSQKKCLGNCCNICQYLCRFYSEGKQYFR